MMDSVEAQRPSVTAFWMEHPFGLHYTREYEFEPGCKEFFDHIRPSMTPFRFPDHMRRLDRYASLLKGRRLLEVGCGLGFESVEYMKRGVRVTASDLIPRAMRLARLLFEHEGVEPEDVRVEDVLDLSFADNTFDAVVATGVVHYTPDPARAMREIHRVLKPNGLAIITGFYRRPSWLQLISRFARENVELAGSEAPIIHWLTEGEIRRLFHGFNIVELSREHIRAGSINSSRNKGKVLVYRLVFSPLYNTLPRRIAERLAAKLSIAAMKSANNLELRHHT
jgi:SAM-dependent methyltransferase